MIYHQSLRLACPHPPSSSGSSEKEEENMEEQMSSDSVPAAAVTSSNHAEDRMNNNNILQSDTSLEDVRALLRFDDSSISHCCCCYHDDGHIPSLLMRLALDLPADSIAKSSVSEGHGQRRRRGCPVPNNNSFVVVNIDDDDEEEDDDDEEEEERYYGTSGYWNPMPDVSLPTNNNNNDHHPANLHHEPLAINSLRKCQYSERLPPARSQDLLSPAAGPEFAICSYPDNINYVELEELNNISHVRASCQSQRFGTDRDDSVSHGVKKMRKLLIQCPPTLIGFGGRKVADDHLQGSWPKENPKFGGDKHKKLKKKKLLYSEAMMHHHRSARSLPSNNSLAEEAGESYSMFKTKAIDFERPFSRMYGRNAHNTVEQQKQAAGLMITSENLNARRYFSALQGPELDILRDSEDTVLSVDEKWPFLLRFPIGCFSICLGLGSQTILWKTLSTASTVHFLHVPLLINLLLWCVALLVLAIVFATYAMKILYYAAAVRREFYHPVRVNFFFAPWIACMFLTLGVPPQLTETIHPATWAVFMAPVFVLELKIYGEWLSGGARRLSEVANPSTHLSVVGNFVGALLAATCGWKEVAIFLWAVGAAHHGVLFVTLYQRLPTAEVLPKELHPVFFLFVAAPSTASVAWSHISGHFDIVSRIAFFVGLFLYSSLVVRINFFRGFRFSVAWWAYTFPMTASAIASIHYSNSLGAAHPLAQGLAVALSFVSIATVMSLCVLTVLHVFVWRTMFPNDVAIAITCENHGLRRRRRRSNRVELEEAAGFADRISSPYMEGGRVLEPERSKRGSTNMRPENS